MKIFNTKHTGATSAAILTLLATISVSNSATAAITGTFPTVPELAAGADSTQYSVDEARRHELIRDTKIVFFGKGNEEEVGQDSIESLIARFYTDQFRNSQDSEAPYFMFMSHDANLAMGMGGAINMEGWFDWNGSIPGGSFDVYDIPMAKTPENWRNLGASVSGTKLFFTLIGRNTKIGNFMAYIQAGFNGYKNSGFKLKKAWFQWEDFQVGLAPTTFSDPAAQPDVLDPAGANGRLDRSNILVRYMHTWKGHWTFAGSVEFPSSQISVDDQLTSKCNDYIPDLATFGQYQWDRGQSHVRLAAILRTMNYQDLVTEKGHHQTGWGALLSSMVQTCPWLSVMGQVSVGQGISSYTGDLSDGDYDLLALPDQAGKLYAPTVLSGTFGLKASWLKKFSSTLALSTMRNFVKDGAQGDFYKYGQYLAVNTVYTITPRMIVGLEYLAGKRKNINGDHSNANRLMAIFNISF